MIEVTDTTPATITDSNGRQLELRLLNSLEQLDLFEACGTNASNQPWLAMALLACTVRAIDGHPVPKPINRAQIRAAIAKLGSEGLNAVQTALTTPEEDEEPGDDVRALADAAKNS